MRTIENIILHCTAGPQTQTVEAILNYWKSIGWKKPGYHIIIRADGKAVILLPIEEISNGVKGFNKTSINICYIGGVEVIKGVNDKGKPVNVIGRTLDNRTGPQLETMERIVRTYHNMFPKAAIKGHRDFSKDKNRDGIIQPNEWMKTCPSFSVAAWLETVNLK